MRELNTTETIEVNGSGAWDDFWYMVGNALGELAAEQAYSKHSKRVFDIGKSGDLNDFLNNQNDPLL